MMENAHVQYGCDPAYVRVNESLYNVHNGKEIPRSKFEESRYVSLYSTRVSSTFSLPLESASISISVDPCGSHDGYIVQQSTLVFVRDLPCKVGCLRMMVELKSLGFDGCYDLLHFPVKQRQGKDSCLGYGFINFFTEADASCFMAMFANHCFSDIRSEKTVRVERAHEQDYSAKLAVWRRTARKASTSYMFDPAGLKAPESSA
eukprot:TRINITY_DN2357_c0_g1_i2.p1 TRINITY_DN2357_c0_g1~~TRINITY_DN2357_c0_g1_i2.p1  ORF type:complete len:204 (+),score=25.19 TRINITY_DN2357_c0_g1_i2:48-659(+)